MYFDQLTSLPNRQKIILDIENKKAKSSIVFNIDDFKEVNDFLVQIMPIKYYKI